jgi:MerR family transcriptional regulator, light-induced transcriptional regulator
MSYSIRDLEQLSGIKAHTLRVWEQRYNILVPRRTDSNIRYYNDEDLKTLLNVSLLNDHGYKISKIANMSSELLTREVMAIVEKKHQPCNQQQALTIAMIDLDEERFERIINNNVLRLGFEKTMLEIIYPFLQRIGTLWRTDSINPAHEHFTLAIIRQKLLVAIDGQLLNYSNPASQRFLLFLPEGELHEVGLLFAHYLIRSRRHRSLYLGQNMPLHDAQNAHGIFKPDFIICTITTTPGPAEIQKYINTLAKTFPNTRILLSGYQINEHDLSFSDNCTPINQFGTFIELLEANSSN